MISRVFERGELVARSMEQIAEDLLVVLTQRRRRRAVEPMRTRFEPHRVSGVDLLARDRVGDGLEEPAGNQLFRRVDEPAVEGRRDRYTGRPQHIDHLGRRGVGRTIHRGACRSRRARHGARRTSAASSRSPNPGDPTRRRATATGRRSRPRPRPTCPAGRRRRCRRSGRGSAARRPGPWLPSRSMR